MTAPRNGPSRARHYAAAFFCSLFVVAGFAAEREWQNGTWRDYKVERPRVLFSAQTRDPNSNLPRTTAAREVRTFVIETNSHRLELRQDATVDTPRIDVLIGEPVLLAIDKKIVYVKDGDGREHKLNLRKQTELPK
jgi:hypothetical protein